MLASHFHPTDVQGNVDANMQPVIGVITQKFFSKSLTDDPRFEKYNSFVMSDYVQFFEGSGARVIPILNTESEEETLRKLGLINAVLMPGGGGDDIYKEKARFIYNEAIKMNDSGTYFPLFGICLGIEDFAMFAATAGDDILSDLKSHHVSLPVTFVGDPSKTAMFGEASDLTHLYETEGFAFMSHNHGIEPEKFTTDKGLSEMFTLTSTSHDTEYDSTFASSMEGVNYPFQAVQFHPAKQVYEWKDEEGYNHDWTSIELNRYFADTWVKMARQNTQKTGDYEETQKMIFENEDFYVTDTYYGNVYMFV